MQLRRDVGFDAAYGLCAQISTRHNEDDRRHISAMAADSRTCQRSGSPRPTAAVPGSAGSCWRARLRLSLRYYGRCPAQQALSRSYRAETEQRSLAGRLDASLNSLIRA